MTSSGAGPLAGRWVLITRPADRALGLVARLVALGASVDSRPAIAFEPPFDAGAARLAATRIATYAWVVFTSATGVRFFLEQLRAAGLQGRDVSATVAVVGPATAREAAAGGLSPAVVADVPHAAGLIAALARRIVPGSRVLLVRPEVTQPGLATALEEAGAVVDAIAFYRTVAAPGLDAVALDLQLGRYDAVVFSSPSTVHAVCAAGAAIPARVLATVRVVALGEVTAHALASAGRPPDATASDPSDAAITQAVLDVLAG